VKGILCEKPMALNMAQANKMVEVCEKNSVQLAIGHQRRFAPQHQKAKKIIDSGEIGNLIFLWGSSPNDLMDWGTHVIDMMRFYAGDIEWVMGQIARLDKNPRHSRGYYTVNIAEGYMKFKNGARGVLETDMQRTRIWVQGEKGEIEVLMDGGLKYISETNPQWTAPELEGRGDTNALEVEALVESIETGKEHLCNGKEGRAATEVLLAISESSHRRSLVQLPLERQEAPLDVMVVADEV
jgi:predicted dehydrogenase